MTTHRLVRTQLVAGDLDTVFEFFEDPMNLERITPPWLHFSVESSTDARVRLGTEISYTLRWHVIPIRWHSRISEYEPGVRFADEMLRGPYRKWYHEHDFREVPDGVEMVDRVEYALPFGPLGSVVHAAIVRRQLDSIFDYRRDVIATVFPSPPQSAALSRTGRPEGSDGGNLVEL